MFAVKRLYRFILRSFLPLFLMTFFIVLFIVLMQFLWRYIDDLVGKGLSIDVLGELFFYAALTMIPMALPLAILLASLMTFGNLGEKFELTAIKASGISLVKVMRPLIILMVLIAIGAFFFQNNVLPVAQTKMWTLLFSVRQKSPELEIPEGVFYDQIPGYNLFVQEKNRETGTLYDIMIYDMSKGFDNARVILADSGKLASTDDNRYLYLQLWEGEMFENLNEAGARRNVKNVPYRRESFAKKELLVEFDANFNRLDEEGMRKQYVGKNMAELQVTIDSLNQRIDSVGALYARELQNMPVMDIRAPGAISNSGPAGATVASERHEYRFPSLLDVDSVFRGSSSSSTSSYLEAALSKAKRNKQEYEFKSYTMKDDRKILRRHEIELQKKFTLSFACIIFFFIGAPLGAIIRKGGLGTSLVISVGLFIVYYIIDNTGYKMARDGRIDVIEGMWLSSAVLLPLGIFFTYKAMNDSALFNSDAYVAFFRRLFGKRVKRTIEYKDVVMDDISYADTFERIMALKDDALSYARDDARLLSYRNYWTHGLLSDRLQELSRRLESTVYAVSNSRNRFVVDRLNHYPVLRRLWIYHPVKFKPLSIVMMACLPVSVPVYLWARRCNKKLLAEVNKIVEVSDEIISEVSPQCLTDNSQQ